MWTTLASDETGSQRVLCEVVNSNYFFFFKHLLDALQDSGVVNLSKFTNTEDKWRSSSFFFNVALTLFVPNQLTKQLCLQFNKLNTDHNMLQGDILLAAFLGFQFGS